MFCIVSLYIHFFNPCAIIFFKFIIFKNDIMDNSEKKDPHGPLSTKVNPEYALLLFQALEPYLTYRTYPKGQLFLLSRHSQQQCFFVKSGVVSLHRQPNDILFEVFEAPAIRGIIPTHPESRSVYHLKLMSESQVAIIDREALYELLTTLNLWKIFALHISSVASVAAEVIIKLSTPSVFNAVRYQLYELMAMSPAVRDVVLAEHYIREKTRLSRSAIMKILSELRRGGYIVISNGHLKDIKYIPEQY